MDPPASKKLRTTNVLVEQTGQSDKVLIDQVTDSTLEEVVCIVVVMVTL